MSSIINRSPTSYAWNTHLSPLDSNSIVSNSAASDTLVTESVSRLEANTHIAMHRHELFDELMDTYNDCDEDGWDGYGAKAMTPEAYSNASCLIQLLPSSIVPPEIGPTNDGNVAFDWSNGPKKSVTLVINGFGDIYYAQILGRRRKSGYDYLEGELSDDLIRSINEIFK